jgi:hypothetical protein
VARGKIRRLEHRTDEGASGDRILHNEDPSHEARQSHNISVPALATK